MTNDAKLGLVAGLGLVIALAIMFSKHDRVPEKLADEPVSVVGNPRSVTVPIPSAPPGSPIRVTATTHHGQNHTVKYGESLYSLARQYYGDGRKYTEIYRVNRRVVPNPDYVPPGTVLFIPDLQEKR